MWKNECPPVHRMIARYLGYKPKKNIGDAEREESMEKALSMFGTGPVSLAKLNEVGHG